MRAIKNKFVLFVTIMSSLFVQQNLQAVIRLDNVDRSQKAFPEAEGFGTYTQGGRGGKVLTVTTLKDNGKQGSLRWAIEQDYPRIVKFAVDGIIVLKDNLQIDNPFITIDGSTAPGDGITLKDGTLVVSKTNDVIIRHLRVRPGDEVALKKGDWKGENRKTRPKDAITVDGSKYVVVDHCSASWSSDEALSVVNQSDNVTVQWCFITEPLANPKLHIEDGKKISHPFGALVTARTVSYIKNLIAYFQIRGPQLTSDYDDSYKEAVNNYVFGYSNSGTRLKVQDTTTHFHVVGNFYEQPKKYDEKKPEIEIVYSKEDDHGHITQPKAFIYDNKGPHRNNDAADQWQLVVSDLTDAETNSLHSTQPLFVSLANPIPSSQVPDTILCYAGATLPKRDCVDTRIVKQVKSGKGSIIDSQNDVGGYCD